MTRLRPPAVNASGVLALRSSRPAVWTRWRLLLRGCACLALESGAVSWYVDNAAVNGSNTGCSWAEACTNFASVIWGANGVTTGNTLFISGGTTGRIYDEIWNVGVAGTSNELVRITRDADNANHNGPVIFDYDHLGD